MAKLPSEDYATVSAVVVTTMLASATDFKDGSSLQWRPDDEYAFDVLFDIISSRGALPGPGNGGQRFARLQSLIHTGIEREKCGRGMAAFWLRIDDEPDAFPPELWQIFAQWSLTASRRNCRPAFVGVAWTRAITAEAMRQWRPRLKEVNREVGKFGVAVPGGVGHVGLRA